jgi:hypothetical protein
MASTNGKTTLVEKLTNLANAIRGKTDKVNTLSMDDMVQEINNNWHAFVKEFELKGAFDFEESSFKNIQIENGKFAADVVNTSAFIGADKAISDMKIVAEYSDAAFQKMTITYKTSNSTITLVYVFES